MKARFAYPLVFLMPGMLVAGLAGGIASAAVAGVLWIFVYGDNPWPSSAETLITGAGILVATGVGVGLLVAAYVYGKGREPAGLARAHVAAALAVTVLLPSLVALRHCASMRAYEASTATSPRGAP